jgi:hypothetical protein
MQPEHKTTIEARLHALVPPSYGDDAGISTRAGLLRQAAGEIERLREALSAIADGEGDAQEIARQTMEAVNG